MALRKYTLTLIRWSFRRIVFVKVLIPLRQGFGTGNNIYQMEIETPTSNTKSVKW